MEFNYRETMKRQRKTWIHKKKKGSALCVCIGKGERGERTDSNSTWGDMLGRHVVGSEEWDLITKKQTIKKYRKTRFYFIHPSVCRLQGAEDEGTDRKKKKHVRRAVRWRRMRLNYGETNDEEIKGDMFLLCPFLCPQARKSRKKEKKVKKKNTSNNKWIYR